MAGLLQGKEDIPLNKMRILGRNALILMLNGNGYYHDSNGIQCSLRPGDAVLVDPELAHAYGSEDGKSWGQVYVVFSGLQFDLLSQSPVYRSHQPIWHLEPVELWKQRLEKVLSTPPAESPIESLRTIMRFTQLIVEMATTDATSRKHPKEAWLEESMHLLGEPYRSGWMSPQEVARQIGQSYDGFRKKFSAKTGLAPGKYQQKRRIDEACAALYRGGDNFKELAEKLGFCDVYHFSKVFRQTVGMPPSVYRRTVRGG